VPEYGERRTFAVDHRVKSVALAETTFEMTDQVSEDVFIDSLGVHTGQPVAVEIEFSPAIAGYVRERVYHRSQKIRERPDGSIRLSLKVCPDWTLKSLILGFGRDARVVSPSWLADDILAQIEEARANYAPKLDFEISRLLLDPGAQRQLPWAVAAPASGPKRSNES
jgi:predicted DNA-binding transcriptional regulator YafY